MFNVAMTHVTVLRSISVDQLVNQSAWSAALSKLAAQWKDATLYVSVAVTSAIQLNGLILFISRRCC